MIPVKPGSIQEQKLALEVLESRNTLKKVSDFYDSDDEFSRALNLLIKDFEYPNYSSRFVHEIAKDIAHQILPEYPQLEKIDPLFFSAIEALADNEAKFREGLIKSVPASHIREENLSTAFNLMAKSFGVTLSLPLQINSLGEYRLSCPQNVPGAQFGQDFAHLLNKYKVRCGFPGPNTMTKESNWCSINHFSAEKMVSDFAQSVKKIDALLSETEINPSQLRRPQM